MFSRTNSFSNLSTNKHTSRQRSKQIQHGFTLIELLVVVAIIGLLAAYVAPKYFSQIGKSEHAVAKAQVEGFSRAIGAYRIDVGSFPTTEEGLAALVNKPTDSVKAAKWNGPYLQKTAPNDPWGRAYIYRSPGAKGDFELISYGSDGQPGGVGDAADIIGE
jgi:general secretion pathway protein G